MSSTCVILLIATLVSSNALEEKKDDIDSELKTIIGNYISKIPDVDTQYVINEGLSKVISQYFKGKITMFPLYKLSLKIDRNPVKIPWTLGAPDTQPNETVKERQYMYIPPVKQSTIKP